MKDAHQEFLTLLIKYRNKFESLSEQAENKKDITEARLNLECAIRVSNNIVQLETLFGDDDIEIVVPANEEDEKPS